eukprot:TRINITY_DN1337_c0_g1_i1.p1 TRINITY_DN1337_c0_g1~~TRINITY_DN1337_c0_g1_i1.p1  ORF type:complete len:516 (-),score=269.04 TRINITY_DN1337_c0_g1_i1:144-1631(-)
MGKDDAVTKEKRRWFVGGLPESCTDADLRSKFEPFGITVESVDVRRDKKTKLCKGFGYLDLEATEKDFNKCLTQLGGSKWKGVALKISAAKPRFTTRFQDRAWANPSFEQEEKARQETAQKELTQQEEDRLQAEEEGKIRALTGEIVVFDPLSEEIDYTKRGMKRNIQTFRTHVIEDHFEEESKKKAMSRGWKLDKIILNARRPGLRRKVFSDEDPVKVEVLPSSEVKPTKGETDKKDKEMSSMKDDPHSSDSDDQQLKDNKKRAPLVKSSIYKLKEDEVDENEIRPEKLEEERKSHLDILDSLDFGASAADEIFPSVGSKRPAETALVANSAPKKAKVEVTEDVDYSEIGETDSKYLVAKNWRQLAATSDPEWRLSSVLSTEPEEEEETVTGDLTARFNDMIDSGDGTSTLPQDASLFTSDSFEPFFLHLYPSFHASKKSSETSKASAGQAFRRTGTAAETKAEWSSLKSRTIGSYKSLSSKASKNKNAGRQPK